MATMFSVLQPVMSRVALAAGADRGDVQLLVGGLVPELLQRWHAAEAAGGNGARQQRAEEEMASGKRILNQGQSNSSAET